MIWDGKTRYNRQTLVPHSKGGAHRLRKRHIKGIEVDGVQSIIKSDGTIIIVQQDAYTPEVGGWLNGDFLAVMPNHPIIVAAAESPGSRVLPNPFMFGGRFVCKANGIPAETK